MVKVITPSSDQPVDMTHENRGFHLMGSTMSHFLQALPKPSLALPTGLHMPIRFCPVRFAVPPQGGKSEKIE